MLEGRQFYPWEVNDLLEAARAEAWKRYLDNDDATWLRHNVDVSAVAVEMRRRADQQSNDTTGNYPAVVYHRGDEGWNLVDAALQPFQGISVVENAVESLPVDIETPAGWPPWVKPVIIGGVAVTVIGLGAWWVMRASKKRRR